jgi:uncharacterized protein (DUF2252 family)
MATSSELESGGRVNAGKALRSRVPRSAHAAWQPPADRADPVTLLEVSSLGRIPELVPIRYGRMALSPFSFFRGAANLMAADLASTPSTGLRVQVCGDCHLMNFGGFATPERSLIFDINDFDETLPGPWEWDVKRLATSLVLASRHLHLRPASAASAAFAATSSYRLHMADYAQMPILDLWYTRLELDSLAAILGRAALRKSGAVKAAAHSSDHVAARLSDVENGKRRIIEDPPLIFHATPEEYLDLEVAGLLLRYRESLPDHLRVLLDRYRLIDAAYKVVGVGSVGTRCAVVLLMADERNSLVLQLKEARRSVLEPFVDKSCYSNQGRRVVVGQHLMQAASDMFLGWTRDDAGHEYYFRQLRDWKTAVSVDEMGGADLAAYAGFCGWALARAHARTGDPAAIAGYIGRGDQFDRAVLSFSNAYADQTERDYTDFMKAIDSGRLPCEKQEPALAPKPPEQPKAPPAKPVVAKDAAAKKVTA